MTSIEDETRTNILIENEESNVENTGTQVLLTENEPINSVNKDDNEKLAEIPTNSNWKVLWNTIKVEIVELFIIGWPLAVTFITLTAMQFVDMMFLGRLSNQEYLAGAALATAFSYICVFPVFGTIGAIETLVPQAFGSKHYDIMQIILIRGIIVVSILCIPVSLLFAFSQPIFGLVVKEEELAVAKHAATYLQLLIPGLWPFILFRTFFSYLTSQNEVYGPMIIGILANFINVLLNFILVTGIGYESLGFIGAPIATSISRWCFLFMTIAHLYIRSRRGSSKDMESSYRHRTLLQRLKEALLWSGMKDYLKLAIPSALMLALEVWGFELTTVSSSLLGSVSTSAHAVVLNYLALTFMIPLSIAVAASVRVGQKLGANDPIGAKRTCWISVALAIGYMLINGTVIFTTRSILGKMFTDDEKVMLEVATIAPIAAIFQMFDGAQVAAGGVLRGLGKQNIGAVMVFIAYYIIGLPVGCFFAFYIVWGLFGLWLGLLFGLGVVCILMNLYVALKVDWKLETERALQRVTNQETIHVPELTNEIEMQENN